jgi:lactoylglutathione lyase
MNIAHVAIWVNDLEAMKTFYCRYFDCTAGPLYCNEAKGFKSYFLNWPQGCTLELMHIPHLNEAAAYPAAGWAHIAIATGNKTEVDNLSARLANDGFSILDGPRTTGDGFYECVVTDPEGNRVEITT